MLDVEMGLKRLVITWEVKAKDLDRKKEKEAALRDYILSRVSTLSSKEFRGNEGRCQPVVSYPGLA
jgi:hypothetical protein